MLSLSYYQNLTPQILGLLEALTMIESPTYDKDGVDRVGRLVADTLAALGAQLEFFPQTQAGDHLLARWDSAAGDASGPPILLLLHMDTVHPLGALKINPPRVEAGRFYGPGALDMKASIAMAATMFQALGAADAWPQRPVWALFTSDEETGSATSRSLIEYLGRQAAQRGGLVLCMEPALPNGALKTWRTGVGIFELVVHGRASHAAADHRRGRNALVELAHQVLALSALTDYDKGTTVNVGVAAGGTASNVVPQQARAEIDFRMLDMAEAERLESTLRGLQPVTPGTRLEARGGLNRPPMPFNPLMARTFRQAQQIGARLGLALKRGGTGGGSDANFVAPLEAAVLDGLGPLGRGAHTDDEYVEIASLAERTALLSALVTEWSFDSGSGAGG